jgi:hypothetical protein
MVVSPLLLQRLPTEDAPDEEDGHDEESDDGVCSSLIHGAHLASTGPRFISQSTTTSPVPVLTH